MSGADDDGIRIHRQAAVRPGVWLFVGALVLLGLGVALLSRHDRDVKGAATRARQATPSSDAAPRANTAPETRGEVGGRPQPAVIPRPRRASTDDGGRAEQEHAAQPNVPSDSGPAPEDGGDTPRGIALFPPPGTSPVLRGIIVPDDFELPPGYVRHHQVTDDGKPLPAILMFHPDYKPLDEHGNPIALPEDRVVPPEMAPPGLEVHWLDVPDNAVPMIEQPPPGADFRDEPTD